jgi:hypothetical protein
MPGQRTLAGGLHLTELAQRTLVTTQVLLYSINQDARRARWKCRFRTGSLELRTSAW